MNLLSLPVRRGIGAALLLVGAGGLLWALSHDAALLVVSFSTTTILGAIYALAPDSAFRPR